MSSGSLNGDSTEPGFFFIANNRADIQRRTSAQPLDFGEIVRLSANGYQFLRRTESAQGSPIHLLPVGMRVAHNSAVFGVPFLYPLVRAVCFIRAKKDRAAGWSGSRVSETGAAPNAHGSLSLLVRLLVTR